MKYLIIICFIISIATCAMAGDLNSKSYEPSEANAYQGRLLYDSSEESYPIDKMMKLCDKYTGIDTAQIKCKEYGKGSLKVCDYKCSLHWSAIKKNTPRACCRGLVPECLACEEGISVEAWLDANPDYQTK